ncbi:MAG: hypothetical protein ABI397_01760 [Candidatus Saccharimonas sp.]
MDTVGGILMSVAEIMAIITIILWVLFWTDSDYFTRPTRTKYRMRYAAGLVTSVAVLLVGVLLKRMHDSSFIEQDLTYFFSFCLFIVGLSLFMMSYDSRWYSKSDIDELEEILDEGM